jgi:alcohol dehydrogenase class IV
MEQNMQTYEKNPVPRELFGEGTSLKTGARLHALGATKCFVVTDKGVVAAGIADPITQAIRDAGLEVYVYDKVEADAPDWGCIECGNMLVDGKFDAIVAIGGGSVMDTAKVASIITGISENVSDLSAYAVGGTKMKNSYRRQVVSIFIPTTAGTGAESTFAAIINDVKRSFKISIVNESMQPNLAIIDPGLTMRISKCTTATCGIDIIAHGVERLIGFSQNDAMNDILFDCVARAWKWLPIVLDEPDNKEGRSQLAWAAHQITYHPFKGWFALAL